MLYNQIIACICPLIQNVANISIASYSIFNLTFLDWMVQCFTQPCYKMWYTAQWWNMIWHIQTLSKADLPTAVVVPRKPDFARLTCPCATLAPQHTWRKNGASCQWFIKTSMLWVAKGWLNVHWPSNDTPRRTHTHRSSAIYNQRRSVDPGPVLAWASKSEWTSHDQSKSCRGTLKRVGPKYTSV